MCDFTLINVTVFYIPVNSWKLKFDNHDSASDGLRA